jgi:hypothetical protein
MAEKPEDYQERRVDVAAAIAEATAKMSGIFGKPANGTGLDARRLVGVASDAADRRRFSMPRDDALYWLGLGIFPTGLFVVTDHPVYGGGLIVWGLCFLGWAARDHIPRTSKRMGVFILALAVTLGSVSYDIYDRKFANPEHSAPSRLEQSPPTSVHSLAAPEQTGKAPELSPEQQREAAIKVRVSSLTSNDKNALSDLLRKLSDAFVSYDKMRDAAWKVTLQYNKMTTGADIDPNALLTDLQDVQNLNIAFNKWVYGFLNDPLFADILRYIAENQNAASENLIGAIETFKNYIVTWRDVPKNNSKLLVPAYKQFDEARANFERTVSVWRERLRMVHDSLQQAPR